MTSAPIFDLRNAAPCQGASLHFDGVVEIGTPAQPWAYAATVSPDATVLAAFPERRALEVEVDLDVHSGRIGVGCLDADGRAFLVESYCDRTGTAKLIVKAPRHCGPLVLRNASTAGFASRGAVRAIRTREIALVPGTGNRLDDQLAIVGQHAAVILDVGAHRGTSAIEYLEAFPSAHVFSFEPDPDNSRAAGALVAAARSRHTLIEAAVSDSDGRAVLRRTSNDAAHSLFPLGRTDGLLSEPIHEADLLDVETVTLDAFASRKALDRIDILKMDIQGGELAALKGARRLLSESRIDLLVLEVAYQQIYAGQPLFWDIGAYLHRFGYGLFACYDLQYATGNPLLLTFADAIFVSARHSHSGHRAP